MILIQQTSNSFYTLTTEKGRDIEVALHSWGAVSVYIQRNGLRGLPMGRKFSDLPAAVESYKAADVKAALRALISELV